MERQQPVSLVVAALRTLSVIVRSNPQVISMLDSREAMKTLIDKLGHIDEEVRVYSCSCIYFFLLRNLSSHGPILSAAECQDQLRRAAQDDWSEMELNDAEEIMNLLEIPHDPLRVSGCIQSRMAPGTDPQVLMGDADD
ncbi:hypothetical protein BC828DRAFT_377379 [Blastocladiella britannica]|nr:hypothetical protein BC828DRAFT_377379 [Blastocladiella britannica]